MCTGMRAANSSFSSGRKRSGSAVGLTTAARPMLARAFTSGTRSW